MKRVCIIIFSVFICIGAYAQKFKYTPQQDSFWVAHLLENRKEKDRQTNETTLPKEGERQGEWISGNVVYSPDSCVRIAQLGRDKDYSVPFTVQYLYQGKIIEQNLPSEDNTFYFQNYPIREIYKLPDSAKHTYLIISSDQEKGDEGATSVASVIVLEADSLKEIPFIFDGYDYYYRSIFDGFVKGNSIEVSATVDKKWDTPIKYNPISTELGFMNTGGTDSAYNVIYKGVFKYVDTAFTLQADSIFYDPPLESFKKTIKTKIYEIGDYTIKAWAVSTYEEIGMGVLPVLTFNYKIGKDTISEVTHDASGDGGKLSLKPEYKLQKDGSLIILTTDVTYPNHPGECGMCENDEFTFWLVKKGRIKEIFSFSYNAGSLSTTRSSYEYNIGKTTLTGGFYLKNSTIEEEEQDAIVEEPYWKNNSTYVVRVSNEKSFRNFYIHFDTKNNVARMEVGKLLKENINKNLK